MARFSCTQRQVTNAESVKSFYKRASVKTDGGVLVDTKYSDKANISMSNSVSIMLQRASVIPTTLNNEPTNYALAAINAVGCSLITNTEFNNFNYSLIETQIDKEVINNPNKLEIKQFTNLQKVPISLENNLKNPSISFYTPDNTIPDADNIYKTAGPSQPQVGSLPNIFATLVDINLNSETVRPLRAFGGLSYVW